MVVGVDADLVALHGHAADQLLIARDAAAHQEEGGGRLPQGQAVQQWAGGGGAGAVVKGEGHQGRTACLKFHRGVRRDRPLRSGKGGRQGRHTEQYRNFFPAHRRNISFCCQYVRRFEGQTLKNMSFLGTFIRHRRHK